MIQRVQILQMIHIEANSPMFLQPEKFIQKRDVTTVTKDQPMHQSEALIKSKHEKGKHYKTYLKAADIPRKQYR